MSAPLPAWLHSITCRADGCATVIQLWFDDDRARDERHALVARAVVGLGWLWVSGAAFCPVHAEALRLALLDGGVGANAEAVRWGLAERIHLRRIEVTT